MRLIVYMAIAIFISMALGWFGVKYFGPLAMIVTVPLSMIVGGIAGTLGIRHSNY